MTDRSAEPASRQRQLPDKPEPEHGGSPAHDSVRAWVVVAAAFAALFTGSGVALSLS